MICAAERTVFYLPALLELRTQRTYQFNIQAEK
jgi:hypothetical protein